MDPEPVPVVERPYKDAYLYSYSGEHLFYEIETLFGLANIFASGNDIHTSSPADTQLVDMALIESSVIHARNIIEFLYPRRVRKTDVVAADFLNSGEWVRIRPAISESLLAARDRANREIAHLTSSRIMGPPPHKSWNFPALARELYPILKLFASRAHSLRLSENVVEALR
jgi:hypothetical protein